MSRYQSEVGHSQLIKREGWRSWRFDRNWKKFNTDYDFPPPLIWAKNNTTKTDKVNAPPKAKW